PAMVSVGRRAACPTRWRPVQSDGRRGNRQGSRRASQPAVWPGTKKLAAPETGTARGKGEPTSRKLWSFKESLPLIPAGVEKRVGGLVAHKRLATPFSTPAHCGALLIRII